MYALKLILQWVGLFEWGYLTLLLMEVVICKDARLVNTGKLFQCSVKARLRLFKRSLKSMSYRIACGLFIGSLLAVIGCVNEIWTDFTAVKKTVWIVFSTITPLCIILKYHLEGFDVTFFKNFKLFLDGRHE